MAQQDTATRTRSAATRRGRRAAGVAATVAATMLVWAAGEPILGYDLVIEQPDQDPVDLGAAAFAFVSLVVSLLAWALIAVLERFTAHAMLIWTIAAAVVFAVSFLPFLGMDADGGTKAVLAVTHVVVGTVLVLTFRSTAATAREH